MIKREGCKEKPWKGKVKNSADHCAGGNEMKRFVGQGARKGLSHLDRSNKGRPKKGGLGKKRKDGGDINRKA